MFYNCYKYSLIDYPDRWRAIDLYDSFFHFPVVYLHLRPASSRYGSNPVPHRRPRSAAQASVREGSACRGARAQRSAATARRHNAPVSFAWEEGRQSVPGPQRPLRNSDDDPAGAPQPRIAGEPDRPCLTKIKRIFLEIPPACGRGSACYKSSTAPKVKYRRAPTWVLQFLPNPMFCFSQTTLFPWPAWP